MTLSRAMLLRVGPLAMSTACSVDAANTTAFGSASAAEASATMTTAATDWGTSDSTSRCGLRCILSTGGFTHRPRRRLGSSMDLQCPPAASSTGSVALPNPAANPTAPSRRGLLPSRQTRGADA